MVKITMRKALENLAELNDYEKILIKTNAGEPQTIELAIDDIIRNAEDPDEVFDLYVTEDGIRELDEDDHIKTGEPLYKVVKNEI